MKKYTTVIIMTIGFSFLTGIDFGLIFAIGYLESIGQAELGLTLIPLFSFIGIVFLGYTLTMDRMQEINNKQESFEWEKASLKAQEIDPRITESMREILISKARRDFMGENKTNLEKTVLSVIIEEKSHYILMLWKELIPSFQEEKEESQK